MGDIPVQDQNANSEKYDDRFFELMKSEKEHVDEQISSFMEIQMKILAFLFPALGLAAGWIFGGKTRLVHGSRASCCLSWYLRAALGSY